MSAERKARIERVMRHAIVPIFEPGQSAATKWLDLKGNEVPAPVRMTDRQALVAGQTWLKRQEAAS